MSAKLTPRSSLLAALLAIATAQASAQPGSRAPLRSEGVITYQPGAGAVTIDGRTVRLSTRAEEALRQRLQEQGWRPGEPVSAHFNERHAGAGGPIIDDIQPVEKP
jgi:hypothetical protein